MDRSQKMPYSIKEQDQVRMTWNSSNSILDSGEEFVNVYAHGGELFNRCTCLYLYTDEKPWKSSWKIFAMFEKRKKSILHLAYLEVFLHAIAHHPSKAWFSVKEKQSFTVTICNFLEAPT